MSDSLRQLSWLIELIFVMALLGAIMIISRHTLKRFKLRAPQQEQNLRYHLDEAILHPLYTVLWLFFVFYLIDLVMRQFKLDQAISFTSLRNAGIVLCSGWFLLRWKRIVQRTIAARRSKGKLALEPGSIEIFGRVFSFIVVFLALLIVLEIFGLNITPLLAFGGIGAAALGFASKDVISNFYGGFMIYLTRPFTINDLVELPQKKMMGHVEEIGWYFTSLRDQQKKPIYVPNAVFTTEVLVNLSRMTHRRIEEKIYVRLVDYDRIEQLLSQIRELIVRTELIDRSLAIDVFLASFKDASLEIEMKAYTLSTRYEEFMKIKQEILLGVYKLMKRTGAEIATATTEVFLLSK